MGKTKFIFFEKYDVLGKNEEELKLGIKFPFVRKQMENMIFYRWPLAYW